MHDSVTTAESLTGKVLSVQLWALAAVMDDVNVSQLLVLIRESSARAGRSTALVLRQELLWWRRVWDDQLHWWNWNLMRWWWQIIVDDVLVSLRAVVCSLHVLPDGLEEALRYWRSVWKWNSWLLTSRCW